MAKKNEEAASSTALATTAPTAITAPPDPGLARLSSRLPTIYHKKILALVRKDPLATIEALPASYKESMLALANRTNPDKPGIHMQQRGFVPTRVRLYHGVGNDMNRPSNTMPGELYTMSSKVLGNKLQVAYLGGFAGRTLWPPRDSTDSKGPLCYSLDRAKGSTYGECASCPEAKKMYTQGGCTQEFTFWFIDKDLTDIYEITLNKSSFKPAAKLASYIASDPVAWTRWFDLETVEDKDGSKRWFHVKSAPMTTPRGGDVAKEKTPVELHPVFEALHVMLDLDVFYPRLADIYDKPGTEAASGGTFNEQELTGGAVSNNPDFSADI